MSEQAKDAGDGICGRHARVLRCLRRLPDPTRLHLLCLHLLRLDLLRLDLLRLDLLRLALLRFPLRDCLRPDLLVNGILRGIVYAEIITKNNILRRLVRRLLYIDMGQHMTTTTHLREPKFIEDFALGGLRGVFLG